MILWQSLASLSANLSPLLSHLSVYCVEVPVSSFWVWNQVWGQSNPREHLGVLTHLGGWSGGDCSAGKGLSYWCWAGMTFTLTFGVMRRSWLSRMDNGVLHKELPRQSFTGRESQDNNLMVEIIWNIYLDQIFINAVYRSVLNLRRNRQGSMIDFR